ncbi:MAG: hypothetical protein N3A72_12155, partial [bacterium]|nr:hypothetical protein [bacterium]
VLAQLDPNVLRNIKRNQRSPESPISVSKPTPPQGLFCVTNTANWVVKNGKRINLFSYEAIDGISNYTTWKTVEKESGKYTWIGLDRMLNEAAQSNKKLGYHILAGTHAPDWAYQAANVTSFEYTSPTRDRKKVKTYLPWIEKNGRRELNNGMLAIWSKTIKAYAQYLNQHPNKNRIAYIAITGGPTGNGLEIMWAQDNYSEFSTLSWDENASQLFIEYWKRCVDIFLDAFPNTPLGLAFTDWFGVSALEKSKRSYVESSAIVNCAIKTAQAKGGLVLPMGLWFGKFNPSTVVSHPLVKLLTSFNVPFGLQCELNTPSADFLEKLLATAVSLNASWIELWHNDIIRDDYQMVLLKYRTQLRR